MKMTTTMILTLAFLNVSAAILNIPASKDNTLYETNADALSNGAGIYFFAGRTAQEDNTLRRGLLQFDLSAIPSGSTIQDATLEITSSRSIAGSQPLSVHTVDIDWGEASSDAPGQEGGGAPAEAGDATWTNAFDQGTEWSTVGGDYNATASASTTASGMGLVTFNSLDLTADIQSWVDGTSSNFGWIVRGNELTGTTAFRFNTRENTIDPPNLIVNFTPPPVTVQLTPAKDNTLFEDPFGATSNGAGIKLFAGKIATGVLRRGLIEFDVSSIPTNAVISDVSVQLNVLNVPGAATNQDIGLHLALAEWGESGSVATGNGNGNPAPAEPGDATWLNTFFDDLNTNLWNTAGGDFSASASSTTSMGTSTGPIVFDSTIDLIADVSTWVQDSNNNHGWIIVGDEVNDTNVRSFGSRESGGSAPLLNIEYSIPDVIFTNGFEQP